MTINGFDLTWDPALPDYYTNVLEISNFDSVDIMNMNGVYGPNSKDRSDIRLSDGRVFRITNSLSRGKDPVITRNKVVN
jgi:hypothetical protein